jgi:hypothetical protein
MIVNEDFKFRDDLIKSDKDTVPIELLTGDFKGAIIRYTTVAIREQEDQTAKLQFEYDVLDAGKSSEVSLRKNKTFEFHIGLILNALILEATDAKDDDANGKDDTPQSIEEPRLCQTDTTLSQG